MIGNAHDIPPPADFIREELEAREWTQRDLAYVLGMAESAVNRIVLGKVGISADMAKALGDAFDVPAEFFLNLQTAYDLSRARTPDPSVAKKGWFQSRFPVREMIKRGWLVEGSAMLEEQMLRFFGVKSADELMGQTMACAAKKTNYDKLPPPAQLAWLYRARHIAREMVSPRYSEKALRDALVGLHALMIAPEEARRVPKILSDCGVRFVLVETLPGAKIDGVCFWIDKSPVIGISTRYDRIDNFWFVLRHEIEHVLRKHGMAAGIIDDLDGANAGTGSELPEEERQANAAARDFCVPTAQMESFVARKRPFFSEKDLLGFAKILQVHPGIVAGQLQRHINDYRIFRKYLTKIRFAVASASIVDGWGTAVPVSL